MLKVEDYRRAFASEHMARDRSMLAVGGESPILLFYEWESFCITYGLFASPEGVLKDTYCKEQGIEVVVRPTGGGILFHENDVPFLLYVPMNGFQWEAFWAKVQRKIIQKFRPILEAIPQDFFSQIATPFVCKDRFCMLEAHGCDFVWKGKKFGGACFRKKKGGLLCQAALFLGDFPWDKASQCVKEHSIIQAMKTMSLSLSTSVKKIDQVNVKHFVALAVKEAFDESRGT